LRIWLSKKDPGGFLSPFGWRHGCWQPGPSGIICIWFRKHCY